MRVPAMTVVTGVVMPVMSMTVMNMAFLVMVSMFVTMFMAVFMAMPVAVLIVIGIVAMP